MKSFLDELAPLYSDYVYSYPHKTAYRSLQPAIPLSQLWEQENRDSLFLYLHIPFCEFRCGFCNLFTQTVPAAELVDVYLSQLQREARRVKAALGEATFSQIAIGGGTPTFLDEQQLAGAFDIIRNDICACTISAPIACECSPATVTPQKLKLLQENGVKRLSIGIQSFEASELSALGRPHQRQEVQATLDSIRNTDIPVLNIDLIYGAANQTPASFLASIRQALRWSPEELFLYPLYVRPLTGLGHNPTAINDCRLECYRAGRDLLLSQGYDQLSMRMFRQKQAPDTGGGNYACQTDGMVGLGCGARSYTDKVHYSTEFAVGRRAVHAILADYIARPAENFATAQHGYQLDATDQQRRFLLLSLLQADGFDSAAFYKRFDLAACDCFPELARLETEGLLSRTASRMKLTPAGLERSDQIGPAMFSPRVTRRMKEYECV